MKQDSCRHCGAELEENKKCEICNQAVQFFCHGCGSLTDEQIHFKCIMKKNEKKLVVTS